MSISEELHKTIDELSEEQQQELLETARQLLDGESEPEEDPAFKANADLDQELTRRYQHLRENPDQMVSARESNSRARAKYGL